MLGEVVFLSVLENEDAAFGQQTGAKHEVGYFGQLWQGVGRVGEDEVESPLVPVGLFNCVGAAFKVRLLLRRVRVCGGFLQVSECVGSQEGVVVGIDFVHALADEAGMVAVEFHADDVAAASGEQFERDASGAGKEVECAASVEVDVSAEHVEDVLFGKVSGGSCLKGAWDVESPSFVFSCDDAHLLVDS